MNLIDILRDLKRDEDTSVVYENTEEEIQREILRLSVKDLAFYGLLRVRFFAALGLILALMIRFEMYLRLFLIMKLISMNYFKRMLNQSQEI